MRHSGRRHGSRHFEADEPGSSRGRHGGFGDHDGELGQRGGHGPRGRRGEGRRGGGQRRGRPRGDVRAAILVLLAEQPRHGYDLIRAIDERSGGSWTPSAGSIYPTLQVLEDEGLLTIDTVDGRRTASLTPDGLAWVDEHAEHHSGIFDSDDEVDSVGAMRVELMGLRDAAMHVARRRDGGTLASSALAILVTARKDMYRLLADHED